MSRIWDTILRWGTIIGCAYEIWALTTRRTPPLTRLLACLRYQVPRLGPIGFWAAILGAVAHFWRANP